MLKRGIRVSNKKKEKMTVLRSCHHLAKSWFDADLTTDNSVIGAYVTNNGLLVNISVIPEKEQWAFLNNNGTFRRECTVGEAQHLTEGEIELPIAAIQFPNQPHLEAPTWFLMKEIKILDNYSNFDVNSCRTGGNYSFHEKLLLFAAVVNNEWTFRTTTVYSTSAGFEYDELYGCFQQNLNTVEVINTFSRLEFRTQGWDQTTLEQISDVVELESFLHLEYEYIGERDNENDGDYSKPALSGFEREEIISQLKDMGWVDRTYNYDGSTRPVHRRR